MKAKKDPRRTLKHQIRKREGGFSFVSQSCSYTFVFDFHFRFWLQSFLDLSWLQPLLITWVQWPISTCMVTLSVFPPSWDLLDSFSTTLEERNWSLLWQMKLWRHQMTAVRCSNDSWNTWKEFLWLPSNATALIPGPFENTEGTAGSYRGGQNFFYCGRGFLKALEMTLTNLAI